jgi:hypothetical protein
MLTRTQLSAAELHESAQRIKALRRAATEHAIEIGQELLRVKQSLPHGAFVKWVERACDFKIRTAQNLMKLASETGPDRQLVALMVPSTLRVYLARTTPPAVRNTILRRLENGGRISRNELCSEVLHERAKAMPGYARGHKESSHSSSAELGFPGVAERRGDLEGDRSRMVADLILRRLSRKDYEAIMAEMNWEVWNRVLVWLRAARTADAERVEPARPGAGSIAVHIEAAAR